MDAGSFIAELSSLIEPLMTEVNLSYWELNTTNSLTINTRYLNAKKNLLAVYADPVLFQRLKGLTSERSQSSNVQRQVDLLYCAFLTNQIPTELLEEMLAYENEIETEFVNYRATLDGAFVSDNDLSQILATTTDSNLARLAWESSKQIAEIVAPKLRRLVTLRNKAARLLGFKDFFILALYVNEINLFDLFNLMQQVTRITETPFTRYKHSLDQSLAAKFQLSAAELKPWHYSDPFFQELPLTGLVNFAEYFQTDLLKVADSYFTEIGLDPSAVLKRSDLWERPGKSQQAFCTDINQAGDVRILCNLRPNEYGMSTLLHELGHGLYDLNHNPGLPYLLRTPAHILTTEAIAMMFSSLTKEPQWLKNYLQIPEKEIQNSLAILQHEQATGELVFMRWGLVFVNFEYQLYQNPDQNLTSLWWDLVAKYQKLTRPLERNQPDWAAKIHLGTAPVYYQNYILGSLAAAQIARFIKANISRNGSLVQNKAVGRYLAQNIFQPGATLRWNRLLESATGAPLTPFAFKDSLFVRS